MSDNAAGTLELLWHIVTTGCQNRTASLLLLHSRNSGAFDSQLPLSDLILHAYSVPSMWRATAENLMFSDSSGRWISYSLPVSDPRTGTNAKPRMKHVKDVLSDMLWPYHRLDFIPSQSRNWQLVLLRWETPETRQVLSDRPPWCALPLWCRGRMDGNEAFLSARDATTLEFGSKSHNIYDMKVRKLPCLSSGFKKHARRRGNIRL